jgi:mono/diheme cytochrome c family protein
MNMPSLSAVVLALGLWFSLAGFARGEESVAAQAGHNLYSQHCEVCHGLRGEGTGPLAEELRVAPADLTTIALRRGGVFPEAEIREIIDGRRRMRGHGPANMPLWGEVFAQGAADAQHEVEVRDRVSSLVEYLKSIQRAAPTAPMKK